MPRVAYAAMRRALVYVIVLIGLASLIAPAGATDLTVHVTNADGQPLANAALMATWAGAPAASGTGQSAEIIQRHLKFHPHVLVVAKGTSVAFPNDDRTRHQVYSFSPAKTFNIKLYVGRPQRPIVFDKTGVVTLGCFIHDYMQAFIVVTERPRWAVTDKQGRAVLHDLPDDQSLRLAIWHPWMPGEKSRARRKVRAGMRDVNVQLAVRPPPSAHSDSGSSLQAQFDQLAR